MLIFYSLISLTSCKDSGGIQGNAISSEIENTSSSRERVTNSEYGLAIGTFLNELDEKEYSYVRRESRDAYESIDISLNEGGTLWLYVFTADELQYFQITENNFDFEAADENIIIPDGDGAWELPLYANADQTCYIAILTSSGVTNEIQAIIDLIIA